MLKVYGLFYKATPRSDYEAEAQEKAGDGRLCDVGLNRNKYKPLRKEHKKE
jgi:hypothetical protein